MAVLHASSGLMRLVAVAFVLRSAPLAQAVITGRFSVDAVRATDGDGLRSVSRPIPIRSSRVSYDVAEAYEKEGFLSRHEDSKQWSRRIPGSPDDDSLLNKLSDKNGESPRADKGLSDRSLASKQTHHATPAAEPHVPSLTDKEMVHPHKLPSKPDPFSTSNLQKLPISSPSLASGSTPRFGVAKSTEQIIEAWKKARLTADVESPTTPSVRGESQSYDLGRGRSLLKSSSYGVRQPPFSTPSVFQKIADEMWEKRHLSQLQGIRDKSKEKVDPWVEPPEQRYSSPQTPGGLSIEDWNSRWHGGASDGR